MSKHWPALTGVLGVGMMGAIAYYFSYTQERQAEREAFERLDLPRMSPKEVWDAALKLSAKRRGDLGAENRRMEKLLDNAEEVSRVAEGIKACARMAASTTVPEEVREAVCKHWWIEFTKLFDIPQEAIKYVFEDGDASRYIERTQEWNRIQDELRKSAETAKALQANLDELKRHDENTRQAERDRIVALVQKGIDECRCGEPGTLFYNEGSPCECCKERARVLGEIHP